MKEKYKALTPKGMKLTTNEKRFNAITNRLENFTDGYCPCVPDSIGKAEYKCPCEKSRTTQECCCKLYELNQYHKMETNKVDFILLTLEQRIQPKIAERFNINISCISNKKDNYIATITCDVYGKSYTHEITFNDDDVVYSEYNTNEFITNIIIYLYRLITQLKDFSRVLYINMFTHPRFLEKYPTFGNSGDIEKQKEETLEYYHYIR